MTTFAETPTSSGFTARLRAPSAGRAAQSVTDMTRRAQEKLRDSAWGGRPFHDLLALASEHGLERTDPVVVVADNFLHALPIQMATPELALDEDGDVVFDWESAAGEALTVILRGDGTLWFAARMSATDKSHGRQIFSDTIPKEVLTLIQRFSEST